MVYFTSDHHFDHFNVIKYCSRPYTTREEMNADLITRWNNRVQPEDTVYYLGDFSLSLASALSIPAQLNGKKILVSGNHDYTHPSHRKYRQGINIEKYLQNGWDEVCLEKTITLGDYEILLNHLPYSADEYGYKLDKFRPKSDKILLCGHVHEKWRTRTEPRLMINVGVDVWDYTPVSEEEVLGEVRKVLSLS